jgi:hypothetical protein
MSAQIDGQDQETLLGKRNGQAWGAALVRHGDPMNHDHRRDPALGQLGAVQGSMD